MDGLKRLSFDTFDGNQTIRKYPEKVLMFGEGNFLRAFVGSIFQELAERGLYRSRIVCVQGIENGMADVINEQNGLYTVVQRGMKNGEIIDRYQVIEVVSRCLNPYREYENYLALAKSQDLELVISNTTEFGICFDENEAWERTVKANFPAKLTEFLYRRFKYFGGDKTKGLTFMPCELICDNGSMLKANVLKYAKFWNLGEDFIAWLDRCNTFCNTLVDRIVSGYPSGDIENIRKKTGYEDRLTDVCEPFTFWAIQGNDAINERFKFDRTEKNIVVSEDIGYYRNRKVRILNGAHTMSILGGLLAGIDTVYDMMQDDTFCRYIRTGIDREIIPTVGRNRDLSEFASDVLERFRNPFLNHKLSSIALNSTSKFKERVLPTIKEYMIKFHKVPELLAFSFACLIAFYLKDDNPFINDESVFMVEYFLAKKQECPVRYIMSDRVLWGEDLTGYSGLAEKVSEQYHSILQKGIKKALESALAGEHSEEN